MVESAGSTDRIVLQILSDLMEIRNRRPIERTDVTHYENFGMI